MIGRRQPVLPITAIPIEGESLPGFVLRQVALLKRKTASELRMEISMPGCAFRAEEIDIIARRCGEPRERVQRLSYLPVLNGKRHQFGAIQVPRGALRLWPGRRFCAACLVESPHHRALWDIGFVHACPAHANHLDDRCPACGRLLSWLRAPVTSCPCGADLRAAHARPASPSQLAWFGDGLPLLNGEVPLSLANVGLPPAEALQLAITMGLLLAREWHGSRRIRDIGHHDAETVASVLSAGMNALRDWPLSLESFIRARRDNASLRHGRFGLAKELGADFATWLLELPDLAFANQLRRSVGDCFGSDPIAELRLQKTSALRPIAFSGRCTSLKQATHRLGCSYETLGRMHLSGRIPIMAREGRGVPAAVDAELVAEQTAARRRGIPLKEAAARLGTPPARVRSLLKANLISEVGTAIAQSSRWAIDPAAIAGLVASLESRVGMNTCPSRKLITLSHVAMQLKPLGMPFAEVVRLARDGPLAPAAIDTRVRGLTALLFDRDDVLALARQQREGAALLSVSSAAHRLGLKWEVVDHLISHALLPTVGGGPRHSRLIPRQTIDRFAETYTTGAELARTLRTSPRKMACLLAERGVQPVVGPNRDGCRQNIFSRRDLARAYPLDFPDAVED